MDELRRRESAYYQAPVSPALYEPVSVPSGVRATGREGFIILQWSPVRGADSYRITVSSTQDLSRPDQGVFTASGGDTTRWNYDTGNIALTRYFSVQAVRAGTFSGFSSIVNAASKTIATGAGTTSGSAEPDPTSQPVSTVTNTNVSNNWGYTGTFEDDGF